MAGTNINSVIAVISVSNQDVSVEWYRKLLGRDPDVVPMEGVAEWLLAESAWIQVTCDPERAGKSTAVIVVNDLQAQCGACAESGVTHGDVVEYPEVIRMIEVPDPDGNTIAFVQDLSGGA